MLYKGPLKGGSIMERGQGSGKEYPVKIYLLPPH